jgi:hypothetical protein
MTAILDEDTPLFGPGGWCDHPCDEEKNDKKSDTDKEDAKKEDKKKNENTTNKKHNHDVQWAYIVNERVWCCKLEKQ